MVLFITVFQSPNGQSPELPTLSSVPNQLHPWQPGWLILNHIQTSDVPPLSRWISTSPAPGACVCALLWQFQKKKKRKKIGKSKTIWIQILIKTDCQWVCVTCKQCAFLNRALMVGWCGNTDYVWFYGSYIEQLGKFDDLTLEEKTICWVKAGYYFLTEYRLRCH